MHDECEPTGDGGNSTLTNQNEREILDDCVLIPARAEGAQDQDFH